MESLDEAEKELREAIRINPNDVKAHNNLGLLFDETGRPEEAEKEYREAIGINTDNAYAHNNLGSLLKNQGKYKKALAKLEKAAELFEKQGNLKSAGATRELIEELPG